MLEAILTHIKNWFVMPDGIMLNKFVIEGGSLELPLDDGQYFRIVGSKFNDGLHQYPTTDLRDETFDGAVWALGVPPAVIELAKDIEEWSAKYDDKSPYTSESFGGYSYTKANTDNGTPVTWQTMFKQRLNAWRKI